MECRYIHFWAYFLVKLKNVNLFLKQIQNILFLIFEESPYILLKNWEFFGYVGLAFVQGRLNFNQVHLILELLVKFLSYLRLASFYFLIHKLYEFMFEIFYFFSKFIEFLDCFFTNWVILVFDLFSYFVYIFFFIFIMKS